MINPIDKAQAKLAQMREQGEHVVRMNPLERAKAKPNSKALAIKAFCFDCQGRDADPSWQWRVGNCQIKNCPLWPHRSHQHLTGTPVPVGLKYGTQPIDDSYVTTSENATR